MASSNQSGSLLQEAAKRANAKNAWDIFGEPPPQLIAESHSLNTSTIDNSATNTFATKTDTTKDTDSKKTEISYFVRSGSITPVVGGGIIFIDFEIVSPNGGSVVNFSGSVKTFNLGVGGDLGYVESSGKLTGPYIYWGKKAVLDALDGKTVTGDAFTVAFFNGFTIAAHFNIGKYVDPSYSYEVDGISFGWEGFRGPLRIDHDSFTVTNTRNEK